MTDEASYRYVQTLERRPSGLYVVTGWAAETRLPERFFDPETKIGKLRAWAYAALQAHELLPDGLPTSSRFLFYEAIMQAIIAKEARKPRKEGERPRRPDQDLIEAIFDLREMGLVDWSAIQDENRSVSLAWVHASVRDALVARLDRKVPMLDPWLPDRPPVVLTESRSLAGVLRTLLYEYRLHFAATNGQVGGFLRTDIAPILHSGQRVVYLGDLDLAGVRHIEANTRRVLEKEVGPLRWERLALTMDQVREFKVDAQLKTDKRYKGDAGVHEAYETEVLGQQVIIDLVRNRLDQLLPEPLDDVLDREDDQRDQLRDYLAAF